MSNQPTNEDVLCFRDRFVGTTECPKYNPSFVRGVPPQQATFTTDKIPWTYFNAIKNNPNRIVTNGDIRGHLHGLHGLVLSPDLPSGLIWWSGLDNDTDKFDSYVIPSWAKEFFNFFRSKSGGIHAICNWQKPQKVELVHRFLRGCQIRLDWWKNRDTKLPCESFPDYRQENKVGGHRTCLNMPWFGEKHVQEVRYCPDLINYFSGTKDNLTQREHSRTSDTASENRNSAAGDSGWWAEDSLVAMLTAYRDFIPGFEFNKPIIDEFNKPINGVSYYEVPCPGHRTLGGWPDGNKHSDSDEPILSDKAVVFIRNGWPKFQCMHGHCDGKYGEKKTINDWRGYFDPGYAFFDVEEWLDEYAIEQSRCGQ